MSFMDVEIPIDIMTTVDDPVEDFFSVVLPESCSYDVAVGYFNSEWIKSSSEGIAQLLRNNGVIRWIINPNISDKDLEIFKEVEEIKKSQIIEDKSLLDIIEIIENLDTDFKITFIELILSKKFEFKFAIPINKLHGLFHPKIGLLTDSDNRTIAFSGSYNATNSANTNWECFDIFCSWRAGEEKRVINKRLHFDLLWEGKDSNTAVFYPSMSFLNNIKGYVSSLKNQKEKIEIPECFLHNNHLRDHQEAAIEQWFKNNGVGIFNMATGSGKTVTAISLLTRLIKKVKYIKILTIVIVPLKHLATQWNIEFKKFGFDTIICNSDNPRWKRTLSLIIHDYKSSEGKHPVIIVVNKTFNSESFLSYKDKLAQLSNIFLIADEVHNLASKSFDLDTLSNYRFKLGLSATPFNVYNILGNQRLIKVFNQVVYSYTLENAIKDNVLCEYEYHPILCEFTNLEYEEYYDLSIQINHMLSIEDSFDFSQIDNPKLEILLSQRARLVSRIASKLVEFEKVIEKFSNKKHMLIYCGDSRYDDGEKQIDKVTLILANEKIKTRQFIAGCSKRERVEIIQLFQDGNNLQAITAIKCLDEGVDIPAIRTAFILSSSTNSRQFIQRRGRLLRKNHNKTFSVIYDFVAIPNKNSLNFDPKIEKALIKKELRRVEEFAKTSLNYGKTLAIFEDIKQKFDLYGDVL